MSIAQILIARGEAGGAFGSSRLWLVFLFAFVLGPIDAAEAQDDAAEQQRLYKQMARQPTNYEVTSAYVKVATERGDYEAAIAALERLLFYNPDLPRVRYELGVLYYHLGSYEMARRYFRDVLASPKVDPDTRRRIESYLANADKQLQQSRFSIFAQTGLRYQTNASYAPTSGVVSFLGQDYGLLPSQRLRPDGNAFGLFGLSHDYDLDDQRGDVLETRAIGYATAQFHLRSLDVALFDASFGPRMALAPETLPGVTVKPYATGGDSWVGGSPYFASYGGGVSLGIPANGQLSFEPNVEIRHVDLSTVGSTLSGFNSGTWISSGVTSSYLFSDQLRLDARAYYRRGIAAASFQSFNQWVGEAALPYQFAPPVAWIPQSWMISPYARIIETAFDAASPFIDPKVARTDTEWVVGLVLVTPITQNFGISTTVEFDYTNSTITNYRQQNLSILSGPTARF